MENEKQCVKEYVGMKSIELFAGAGGLGLATANAGFDHDVVLEWNQNACDTIRGNELAGVKFRRVGRPF